MELMSIKEASVGFTLLSSSVIHLDKLVQSPKNESLVISFPIPSHSSCEHLISYPKGNWVF